MKLIFILYIICRVEKVNLRENCNYTKNRYIRNELVGHPVNRSKYGEKNIISLTLFGLDCSGGKEGSISYLRYHKDNNYEYEGMYPEISEIVRRHYNFLNTYFDKMLEKLKIILIDFAGKIKNMEQLIYKKEKFETVIEVVSVDFESIFKSGYIYNKESLLKIYKRRKEHERYQNLIDLFYRDLKTEIEEVKSYIKELFEPKKDTDLKRTNKTMRSKNIEEIDYSYELQKLATKKDFKYFKLHSDSLKIQCENDKLVTDELNNMDLNFCNDIEYYCSYYLIYYQLKDKKFK